MLDYFRYCDINLDHDDPTKKVARQIRATFLTIRFCYQILSNRTNLINQKQHHSTIKSELEFTLLSNHA